MNSSGLPRNFGRKGSSTVEKPLMRRSRATFRRIGSRLHGIQDDLPGKPLFFVPDKFNQTFVSQVMLTPGTKVDFDRKCHFVATAIVRLKMDEWVVSADCTGHHAVMKVS